MTQPNEPNASANGNGSGQPNDTVDASKIDSVDKLPKWAQDELSRARNEAATYRTRLRDAKQEVEAEVRNEVKQEVETLKTELSELKGNLANAELSNLKIEAALSVGVPGEHLKAFAERLRGSTAEELQADAQAAKAMFGVGTPTRATDPTAGLGGNEPKKTPESAFGDFVLGRLSR